MLGNTYMGGFDPRWNAGDSEPGSDSGSDSGSDHADPELSRLKDQLHSTLKKLETFGDFATKKQYTQFANPGLQIGDTLVALPLDPAQVPLIRDASRQAPFGRGEKTLIDTSVRDTWELDTTKFLITNPAWAAFLSDMLQQVSQSLGMTGVRAELYKLLLYEKGSFFKRHRDSEKAAGMIATMSICLPSKYKGGEVHLSHAGKNHVFDTSESIFDVSALAWYADVTHEIKPILEGHRLALIYNIILTSDGPPSAEFFVKQDQQMQTALANLTRDTKPKRLLYFLEHKYSQTSLQMDQLKGRDRAAAQALQQGCAKTGWYMFLCNVTRSSDSDYYGEHRSYYDYDDRGPEIVMDSIVTCSGKTFAYSLEVKKREILGPNPYISRNADSESEGEDTGNEGAEMEYRYHDSALVIVPKDRLEQFFDYSGEMNVLVNLVLDDLKAHPNDPAALKTAVNFLSKAVLKDTSTSPYVLKLAWRLEQTDLFRTAVRSGFKMGVPQNGVIDALVEIVKNQPAGQLDWEKSFGEFVSCHLSLTKLSASLDHVKGLLDADHLKVSFDQWRSTTHLLSFEGKKSLIVDDHDAVLELTALQWENVGWVRNKLVPKICEGSDKKFLSKFICSLLEKDREGVLERAKDLASILLQSETKKLHLGRIKFKSMAGDYEDWEECKRFTQLLDNCLLSGLQQFVDELLQLSLSTIKYALLQDGGTNLTWNSSVSRYPQSTLADMMLEVICEGFEQAKMPLPNEPAREFVMAVLKKFMVRDLPKWPQPNLGHSHKPRGCGRCKHCDELDTFLVSSVRQEQAFQKGPKICEHLESQLPPKLFQCTKQCVSTGKPPQFLLTVVKLGKEHEEEVSQYKYDLDQILHKTRFFRTEYVKSLLGDDTYGELVTLDQLPFSKEVEEAGARAEEASRKRAASGAELPAAKRPRQFPNGAV